MTLLTPPNADSTPLVASAPVEVVEPEQSTSFIPSVDNTRALEIHSQAKTYAKDLVSLNPNSPEFTTRVNDIYALAQNEVARSGRGTSRLLERSLADAKKNGGATSERVATTLADLRSTVADLVPNGGLSGRAKFLGLFPGGKKIDRFFQKYESAKDQLDAITKALLTGKDELMKDNAALQQEKQDLWDTMLALNEYILLANKLDAEIVAEIENLKAQGETQKATTLDNDFLFPVRSRRKELMEQLAVAVQGFMSMELVRKTNVELIRGVERARTTTMFALQTAITVAQAQDAQKKVMDQIDAVNEVTSSTIESTSAMLRQNAARAHEQAVNSSIPVETLTKAFDNIFATIDEIETFKTKANQNMAITINGLQTQLERAKPQLERAIEMEKNDQRALNS